MKKIIIISLILLFIALFYKQIAGFILIFFGCLIALFSF